MLGEVEASFFVGVLCFEHAVTSFRSAARFGDDDGEALAERSANGGEISIDARGVGVVEEICFDSRLGAAESFFNELGAEGGSPDADDDDIFENTAGRGRDFSGVNLLGEFFNGLDGLGDLSSDFGSGCEGRIAQPVVTNHAAFIGVGNCTCLQLLEVGERLFDF